jgi:hypothetical protein
MAMAEIHLLQLQLHLAVEAEGPISKIIVVTHQFIILALMVEVAAEVVRRVKIWLLMQLHLQQHLAQHPLVLVTLQGPLVLQLWMVDIAEELAVAVPEVPEVHYLMLELGKARVVPAALESPLV